MALGELKTLQKGRQGVDCQLNVSVFGLAVLNGFEYAAVQTYLE